MYVRSRGFGSTTSVTAATIAASGATTTLSLLAAYSVITGPVGAAIAGLVGIAVLLVKTFQGCGATCVQASQYANQVELNVLRPNLETYLNSPVRTVSMQAAALNTYNTGIQALVAACGQANLAKAGANCIDERVNASSCQWKASPGGWDASTCTYTGYGASGSGNACVNWVVLYHDPIANDPCVQPDSVLTSGASGASGSAASSGSSGGVFGLSAPVAIGGLLLAAWLLGGD